ncbi:hypothetical protein AB0H76_16910 [Nocardia sp. NPDC050712]|uniref:hypothetical protein n=1 Tax=Nocardia sp. NPDC050712 TaxID=3155518 RepID=UPI0033D21E6A
MTSRDGQVSIAGWIGRVIAVVVLIPLRLLWEGLKALGRALAAVLAFVVEKLLAPGAQFVWDWVIRPVWLFFKDFLWGWLVQHVLWGLVLTPILALLLDYFLRPLRRALEDWLWRRVLRPAAQWLFRWVLAPVGRAIAWLGYQLTRWVIVWPLTQLWRWVLHPLWKALRATLIYAWRLTAVIVGVLVVIPCRFVYRTVLRPIVAGVAATWRFLVVRPARWLHATVITPMNRWAADLMAAVFGR